MNCPQFRFHQRKYLIIGPVALFWLLLAFGLHISRRLASSLPGNHSSAILSLKRRGYHLYTPSVATGVLLTALRRANYRWRLWTSWIFAFACKKDCHSRLSSPPHFGHSSHSIRSFFSKTKVWSADCAAVSRIVIKYDCKQTAEEIRAMKFVRA